MPKVTFNNQKNIFFADLNARVEQYFKERNLRKTGNFHLYLKSFILIPATIAIYVILLTVDIHAVPALILCSTLGFLMAFIGFNVMHDANHGSYSRNKTVNNVMSLSANCLGVNSFIWKQKHNIIHHTYTNVDGIDDDIAKMPILRHCPSQKFIKMHRYQYIYCWPLYGFTTLLWTLFSDFTKYFNRKIYTTPIRKMELKEHFIFWISKVLYLFFYIALPVYMVGFLPFLFGFLAMQACSGLTISVVFQLAHVVEDTHFTDANDVNLKIENEWAIHQMETTANFATDNKVISWLLGGLNYQVEHHLFPRISHVHYPAISKIVKESCERFGVRYINFKTMPDAIRSHYRFLKLLGDKNFLVKA